MSSPPMVCFNSECIELNSERPRKGWRLRSGEYAELCDRCGFAFEEGRFCETFHLTAPGWRCCESCGKCIHCGCVVSAHCFVLLDAGGIECVACARNNVATPSTTWWPTSLFLPAPSSGRTNDISVRNGIQTGRQVPIRPRPPPPNFFNASAPRSELFPRVPYEGDISTGLSRLTVSEQLSAFSLEKKKIKDSYERLMNGSLKRAVSQSIGNGISGINWKEQSSSHSNNPQLSSFLYDKCSDRSIVLAIPSISPNERNGQIKGLGTHSQKAISLSPLARQVHGNSHNGVEASSDKRMWNGRPQGDDGGHNQLLSRYWPKSTSKELKQISGDLNSPITPLFEKMLSVSDAGRIGRLILPKKCAEAYLPPISHPEGLPLKVQDFKGQEWIFQFRFWPNNNSRIYVLEGVTACIQSMQLQAGDTVIFSRLEPEGKLVMGFRKANTSSDQDNHTIETTNVASAQDLNSASTWSKIDKSACIAQEVHETEPSLPRKRKNSSLGSSSKRLRVDHEEMTKLKLTLHEAQGLLRPPCDHVPNVVIIEGFEFEEYEDPPMLGRPTIFDADNLGIQWVQCEDCLKWRRIPHNALLPSKWTCSGNLWDPERSICSASQELTTEQVSDMLSSSNPAASKKLTATEEPTSLVSLDRMDALAKSTTLEEAEGLPSSSQATTKHPRHRPGCSCIVCIQPPSGKGPKHKQACLCDVCLTVKRRFHTLMLHREKKLSEKEDEPVQKQEQEVPPEEAPDENPTIYDAGSSSPDHQKLANEGSSDDHNRSKSSTSPFVGQFDLNMQPEWEDELSLNSDPSSTMLLPDDAIERQITQQTCNLSWWQ